MILDKMLAITPVILVFFLLSNCKKDELTEPSLEENDTISTQIPVDQGQIGLIIDTRLIAKKGYIPAKASIDFEAEYGNYSRNLSINPDTYIATLKYEVDRGGYPGH